MMLEVEEVFEVPEVLVVGTEQRFDPFVRDRDLRHGGVRNQLSPLLSCN